MSEYREVEREVSMGHGTIAEVLFEAVVELVMDAIARGREIDSYRIEVTYDNGDKGVIEGEKMEINK